MSTTTCRFICTSPHPRLSEARNARAQTRNGPSRSPRRGRNPPLGPRPPPHRPRHVRRGPDPRPWLRHHGHGRGRPRRHRRCADRLDGRPDRGRRHQQPQRQRRLDHPVEQRGEVGLRQGHRGHVLHQPVLRAAVQRLVQRRHDPRRVPLRDAGHHERRDPGQLLRGPRRRLVARRPYAAGRARHRVEPVRRRLLRALPGRDGQLDPRLREPVPGPHRP